jgi:glycosyltransferase involved in cell wall biosynthesis
MRVGSLCYATSQGLGHLMLWFHRAGVIDRPAVYQHPSHTNHTDWYPPGTPVIPRGPSLVRQMLGVLDSVDVMLFFETPFDWSLLRECRARGVKTALMTMYEWTPARLPETPDLFLCPSLLDLEYFPSGKFLPVPADPSRWEKRTRALRFLHNAGNIGCREHKGTRQLLEAVPFVKSDFRLTVRAQEGRALRSMAAGCPAATRDRRVRFEYAEMPYDELWKGHDVLVAPEKYNGLSLPLQEAFAAGMAVMTTDRFPANAWLPPGPLIPTAGRSRARVGGGYNEFEECLVRPEDVAAKVDEYFGRDISDLSAKGREWALANSWEVLKPEYLKALGGLLR